MNALESKVMKSSHSDMRFEVRRLDFSYGPVPVLRQFNFRCDGGEKIWLRGKSGSGKSTFLKLAAGLLSPAAGDLLWNDFSMGAADEKARTAFRKANIAFGDQDLHLIESWSLLQNLILTGAEPETCTELLRELELTVSPTTLARHLSGGQKQKLLLARMILQTPKIVLLDEPTAHLDDSNTAVVMKAVLKHFAAATVLIVSHDQRLAAWLEEAAFPETTP
jgi:putative ABC transport system ATP-binding protein